MKTYINIQHFILQYGHGGSFVYVPKGVNLEIPIQSYYRLNAAGAGQFEHTLIVADDDASISYIEGCSAPKYNVVNLHAGSVEIFVGKNAKVRFSTIENWSKNMYNLNTKRAIVEENGKIEWISRIIWIKSINAIPNICTCRKKCGK